MARSYTKPTGRPSKFTDEIAREIAERIGNGEPLAQICRDDHMPGLTTVYDWQGAHPAFSESIARARIAGFDHIAADMLKIADTPVEGTVVKMELGEDGEMRVVERRVEDMLGHRKLQVETRMKLLAKWDPKRYGDFQRTEVSGPDGGAILTTMPEDQLDKAIAAQLAKIHDGSV